MIPGPDFLIRQHGKGSLKLPRYVTQIRRPLRAEPEARIFVATDAHSSVDYMRNAFGSRVISCDSIRHESGEAAGKGPAGWIMV